MSVTTVKKWILAMIEEANSDKGVINSGRLPDKPTHEFTPEELQLIMDNHPASMIELFDRSDWEIDDAGRQAIINSLRSKAFDEVTGKTAAEAFDKLDDIHREVLIRYHAVIYTSIGFSLYEGMHIRDKDNPIAAPKFVDDVNYETLIMCITNPKDNIALFLNPITRLRVITSAERAKRYYTDGLVEEYKIAGIDLIDHTIDRTIKISHDNGDPSNKFIVRMVGHHYENGKKMVIVGGDIIANAAKDIVMNRLRSKLLKKFRQEEDDDNSNEDYDNVNNDDYDDTDRDYDDDNNDDDDDNRPDLGFSSRLNFPKW